MLQTFPAWFKTGMPVSHVFRFGACFYFALPLWWLQFRIMSSEFLQFHSWMPVVQLMVCEELCIAPCKKGLRAKTEAQICTRMKLKWGIVLYRYRLRSGCNNEPSGRVVAVLRIYNIVVGRHLCICEQAQCRITCLAHARSMLQTFPAWFKSDMSVSHAVLFGAWFHLALTLGAVPASHHELGILANSFMDGRCIVYGLTRIRCQWV